MSSEVNNIENNDAQDIIINEFLDDIIDLSHVNFDDNERWLLSASDRTSSSSVEDLQAWLRKDLSISSIDDFSNDTTKIIDTRTFTRPKKNGRMSLESIMEITSPTSNNVWKLNYQQESSIEINNENDKNQKDKESIPAMLRPSVSSTLLTSLSSSNGQESLDAFLNMSQSNGIDSFINLTPDFNDATIMNTSRPFFLDTSTTDIDKTDEIKNIEFINNKFKYSQCNDDSGDCSAMADSQILTESMMQTSMFSDVSDVCRSSIFSKDYLDNSNGEIDNTSHSKTLTNTNKTFTSESLNVSCKKNNDTFTESLNVFNNKNFETLNSFSKKSDATFTESVDILSTNYNKTVDTCLLNNMSIENEEIFIESHDTFETKPNDTVNLLTSKNNETFTESLSSLSKKNNETFTSSELKSALSTSSVNNRKSLNANTTYDADLPNHLSYIVTTDSNSYYLEENQDINDSINSKLSPNSTFNCLKNQDDQDDDKNTTFRLTHDVKIPFSNLKYEANENNHHSSNENIQTMTQTENNSSKNKMLNTTFESPLAQRNHEPKSLSTTFATATLNDLDVPNKKNLDKTYDTNFKEPILLPVNRYQTYRKNPLGKLQSAGTIIKKPQLSYYNDNQGRSLDNITTEIKKTTTTTSQLSKLNGPKTLTKLPQTLQKSNPNLLSNQRISELPKISNFGFNHGKKLNDKKSLFTSKLRPMMKTKCGSDARLEKTGTLACGSTESIASTHSAPDLDDRLSECSDSSHTSGDYCQPRTMTINNLKCSNAQRNIVQIVSTPKPDKNVMENNWMVSHNDLPSPILKNDEGLSSRGSSPASGESTVKTSSPLLSPAESLQSFPINSGLLILM